MDKHLIRKEIRRKRNALSEEEFKRMSQDIYSLIFSPSFYLPEHIGIYVSYQKEVDTIKIIQQLLLLKKHVYVPLILGERKMEFVEIFTLDDLRPGYKGILEPISRSFVDQKQIELMFTPLTAFNDSLERIGQGGGYYDVYFAHFEGKKIGLAFEFQHYDFISEEFDIPLNGIITEKLIYSLSKS